MISNRKKIERPASSRVDPSERILKIQLEDGNIHEICYRMPMTYLEIVRLIYDELKFDQYYDWQWFSRSCTFQNTDDGVFDFPPNELPNAIYRFDLHPAGRLARLKRWLWPPALKKPE